MANKKHKKTLEQIQQGAFYRTCQECGNVQTAIEPKAGELKNSYREKPCNYCGSFALDYGTTKPITWKLRMYRKHPSGIGDEFLREVTIEHNPKLLYEKGICFADVTNQEYAIMEEQYDKYVEEYLSY